VTRDRSWLLAILAMAITIVLWASAFVVVRAVGHDYSSGPMALGRTGVGSLALTAIVLIRAVRRRAMPALPKGRQLLIALAWGAAWFGLYNLALNEAEVHLDAGTTALLVNFAPVLVGVLAGLFLGEGFPARLMAGLAVAFAGVCLIAAPSWTGHTNLIGVLLGLAAAVLYAVAAVVQKPLLRSIDALTLTWIGCVIGAIVCLPFVGGLVHELGRAPLASTLGVVYLGVFPTAIAFLTWGYALSRTSAGKLASSTYAVPALVVLVSWFALGEVPAPLAFVGGAVCLVGVAIATLPRRSRGATGAAARQRHS